MCGAVSKMPSASWWHRKVSGEGEMYVSKFLTFGLSAILELAGGVRLSALVTLPPLPSSREVASVLPVYLHRSAMPSACTVQH